MIEIAPTAFESPGNARQPRRLAHAILVVLAIVTGLGLMTDSLLKSSATYDEVLYLKVASNWWRTGDQTRITRAGSPLTFWKLQQVPMLWALDKLGFGDWIDHPAEHELVLLPVARITALWIWLVAMGLILYWSHRLYGSRAMVVSAWWFALSPNVLAHGPLITMETPIVATMTGMMLLFWIFLRNGDRRAFVASAVLGGLAFSCKFTSVTALPIFGLLWCLARWIDGDRRLGRIFLHVASGMLGFTAIMLISDVIITGGAMLTMSAQAGAHPSFDGKFGPRLGSAIRMIVEAAYPQDWVGFVRQSIMQRSGAPSYLFGQVRDTGWRYYYLVAMAVKVPLAFWLILAFRAIMARRISSAGRDWVLPVAVLTFVALASLGSTRNLGIRYLLPIAPLAIIWISALAEGNKWSRGLVYSGLAAQAVAIASIHPYELSYFNVIAGGPVGGRQILSDSNLDWGQGLKPLARLQREHPEFRDLTLFYFGDNDPSLYGIAGQTYTVRAANANEGVPTRLEPRTAYLAVSATLQSGACGTPGMFTRLSRIQPVRFTDDTTIAIYRTKDLLESEVQNKVLAGLQAAAYPEKQGSNPRPLK